MNPSTTQTWQLVSLSPLPVWALVALLALAMAGVALAQRGLRREPRRARRYTLLGLRTVALGAAAFLLLEPGVRVVQTMQVKNRLAILVDRSASMAFPTTSGGPTRAAAVAKYFAASLPGWRKLQARFTLEPAFFDGDVHPTDLANLAAPSDAKGAHTDLLGAVRSAAEAGAQSGGRKLAGVVLVTDGADNVHLGTDDSPQGPALSAQVKAELVSLGAPVSSLVVGQGQLLDLAVAHIAVDDFAFVRNTVEVDADIEARGDPDQSVQVVLRREGKVVATRDLRLHPGTVKYPVKFSFAPDQTGQFVYTVSVTVLPGEAVTSNNSRSFVLKVIRDRIRVLYVVGRPSWDERFLRGLLEQDPNVELVSFFILRSLSDDTHANENELSLIQFPVREIFHDQLHTFDVVILQNFAHGSPDYRGMVDQYLPDIRDYVMGGGALAMVGGAGSFGDGKYGETALADVLPVTMDDATPADPAPFLAQLTAQGARHPVTALAPGAPANARLFASLPRLPGLNITHAKPGAQVLLAQPGTGLPVLALGEYGRGRSMALTTDGLWQWTLPAAANGTPPRAYDKLWTQALRWLVKDPDLTTLRIQADRATVAPGQPIAATVTVRQPDYGPAVGAQAQVRLIQVEDNAVVAQKQAVTGSDGTARVTFDPVPAGPYKLVASAKLGAVESQATDAVAVRASGPELADPAPRPKLLAALAEATGGKSMALPSSGEVPDLPLIPPQVVEVGARKDRPIWDRPWPLLVLVLALGAEWVLRRRWGFL